MRRCTLLLIAVSILAVGCDQKYTVKGKVQFSDGSPLTGGMINFTKGDKGGYSPIQPDGSFEITYDDPKDGLPKGKYEVSITPPSPWSMTEEERKKSPPRSGVAVKYTQPETSGIEVVVEKQETELVIKLEKEKGTGRP